MPCAMGSMKKALLLLALAAGCACAATVPEVSAVGCYFVRESCGPGWERMFRWGW